MRVAFLAWESLHSARAGGLAIVATRLAEETAKRGHDVHLFTRAAEKQTDYEYVNGVHYHRVKFDPGQNTLAFARNMSEAMVSSLRATEGQGGRFDVVHGHDWHVVDALHELKRDGHAIVLTFHSTEYGRNGGAFGDWWEFREISGKEWYGAYIADRIMTVSNTMKNELMWLYKVPEWKIDVVSNAIDPRKYQMNVDPGRVKEKYGIHPLAPVILYVGRMGYQKGPDLLLEAVPKVLAHRWDAKFVFAGEGGMLDSLRARARELGVSENTRFLGFVQYWDYMALLNSADIVVIPSRNEPFGLVLLEAWASCRPVVACDVGGLGENIENFADGVKVYPNPDSVAWGINYLFDNPDAMRRVAEGGRRKVEEFSWGGVIDKLLGTYSAVLGGPAASG